MHVPDAFPVNTCNGPFSIEHSASISPTAPSATGTEFSLTCEEGYSASTESGSIICDETNAWKNIPSCQGIQFCTKKLHFCN